MYYCKEIRYRFFASFDELKRAIRSYPFKNGFCHQLIEEEKLKWETLPKPIITYRAPKDGQPLTKARFRNVKVDEMAEIKIGAFPIILYRSKEEHYENANPTRVQSMENNTP